MEEEQEDTITIKIHGAPKARQIIADSIFIFLSILIKRYSKTDPTPIFAFESTLKPQGNGVDMGRRPTTR